jgi:uncharacterized protein YjbI with pentapeptide repeats
MKEAEREAVAGVVAEGATFNRVTWQSVTDSDFQDCTFVDSDLSDAALSASRFVDCRFERCDLSLWKPVDSVFGGCRFEDSRMLGIDWTLASWPRIALHDPNVFVRCDLSMGTFMDLDLGAIEFRECRLRETSYRFARLAGARFDGSDCVGCDFHGSDLSRARLVGVLGLAVDPASTKLAGATVDAAAGVAILESFGLTLEDLDRPDDHRGA